MSEWKEYKLGDITDWFSGGTPFKQNEIYWNGDIPWISARSLNGTKVSDSEIKITQIGLENGSRIAIENDILLLVRGSGLFNSIPVAIVEKPVAFNQDIKAIRLKDGFKHISPWFILFWFCGNTRKLYSIMEETGIGAGKFDTNQLKALTIKIPDQRNLIEITNTLKALDSKITLLRQQNETLEELAQTLFKRWFVDFEFPNENGEPYKSSGGKMVDSELGEIPEGWNLKTLDSVVNICNGYSYKGSELQESDVAMVTLKNFDRNGGFRFDGFKEIISDNYKDKHVVKDGDLVVAHTDLTQDAEVLGNPAIIMKNNKYRELIISMDLVKVESKNGQISTEFLYFLMADKRFKSHCKGYSNGTTVLHLSKNAIPEYQFAWPKNMSIVSEFGIHAKRTYSKIQNNISEIQNLTSLRDTLLPKLMSGDIEIKPD